MSFAFHYKPDQEPPLVIYISHEDKTRDGHWRPQAIVGFTPTLRSSGFLMAIGPEELMSLLLLLSFIAADGRLIASTLQLSKVLQQSTSKTRARFQRLTEVRWLNQPIVIATRQGDGLDGFAPVPGFVPTIEEPLETAMTPVLRTVPREVIIEHSRRHYARTREEVEREINEMMNWREKANLGQANPKPSPVAEKSLHPRQPMPVLPMPPQTELKQELIEVGLLAEQADDLMRRFDAIRIRRQLAWLPYRMAKNRAGYLIAAIKDDYAAPRSMKPNSKGEVNG